MNGNNESNATSILASHGTRSGWRDPFFIEPRLIEFLVILGLTRNASNPKFVIYIDVENVMSCSHYSLLRISFIRTPSVRVTALEEARYPAGTCHYFLGRSVSI